MTKVGIVSRETILCYCCDFCHILPYVISSNLAYAAGVIFCYNNHPAPRRPGNFFTEKSHQKLLAVEQFAPIRTISHWRACGSPPKAGRREGSLDARRSLEIISNWQAHRSNARDNVGNQFVTERMTDEMNLPAGRQVFMARQAWMTHCLRSQATSYAS